MDCIGLGPSSIKTREVLGNPSLMPKRFPETRKISLGRSPREILRVEGNLEGRGDGFPNNFLDDDERMVIFFIFKIEKILTMSCESCHLLLVWSDNIICLCWQEMELIWRGRGGGQTKADYYHTHIPVARIIFLLCADNISSACGKYFFCVWMIFLLFADNTS